MKKDVLEWEPDRAGAALQLLEKRTVDTSRFLEDKAHFEWAEGKLVCVAYPYVRGSEAGLSAFHVTDDPQAVLEVLERGGDLQERRPWGDICGGLYLSGCPDYWASRSRKQWDFMESLDAEKQERLREMILEQLAGQVRTQYITQSEYENAVQIVEEWRKTGYWPSMVIVAGQPYNVNIQRLALQGGLADPFKPAYVDVDFHGRYLELMENDVWNAAETLASETLGISKQMMQREDVCRALREHGWDGAFTRSSMGTNAELVVWSQEAIDSFGGTAAPPPPGAEMSGPGGRIERVEGKRFEASIYMDHRQANIIDKSVKVQRGAKKVGGSLMILEPYGVDEVRRIADAALRNIPWDFVALRRLEGRGRPGRGSGVQIIDPHHRTMIVDLDMEALEELHRIAEKTMAIMAGA